MKFETAGERHAFVTGYGDLAEACARKFLRRWRMPADRLDDLMQAARVAILDAVERYDPTAGPFDKFATPAMHRRMTRDVLRMECPLSLPKNRPLGAGPFSRIRQVEYDDTLHRRFTTAPFHVSERNRIRRSGGADLVADLVVDVRMVMSRLSPYQRRLMLARAGVSGESLNEVGRDVGFTSAWVSEQSRRVLDILAARLRAYGGAV